MIAKIKESVHVIESADGKRVVVSANLVREGVFGFLHTSSRFGNVHRSNLASWELRERYETVRQFGGNPYRNTRSR